MPLRIAFDLDGVFADMDAELRRHAELLFGNSVSPRPGEGAGAPAPRFSGVRATPDAAVPAVDEDPPPPPDLTPAPFGMELTRRQGARLWRHIESIEGFWESLKEIEPGMIARLSEVANLRRWEVIFLTKRPASAGATAQVQSQRWLAAHGFTLPSVYVVQRSRGRIAAALGLDIVVDDRPENCLDVAADSVARPILVWRDDKVPVPAAASGLGISVVRSVGECLDILTGIDASAEKRSVFDRIKRLLGLDPDPTDPPDLSSPRSRSRTPTLK